MRNLANDFEINKKKAIKQLLDICKVSKEEIPYIKNLIKEINDCKDQNTFHKLLISHDIYLSGEDSSFYSPHESLTSSSDSAEQNYDFKDDLKQIDDFLFIASCNRLFAKLNAREEDEKMAKARDENKRNKLQDAIQQKEIEDLARLKSLQLKNEKKEIAKQKKLQNRLENEEKQAEIKRQLMIKELEEKALQEEIEKQLLAEKNKKKLEKEKRRIEFFKKQEEEMLQKKENEKIESMLRLSMKTKDNIFKNSKTNFKNFQLFFDFLREKKYLDIGEIGHFGSRVYGQLIGPNHSENFSGSPRADFDFFCIPTTKNSRGIFVTNPDEMVAKINFQDLLNEFNEINPFLQISLVNEENGKKNVNHGGKTDSLNFKLVATFFDEKSSEGKPEKIIKEEIEFDLNFYTQQSILQNLQWQLNLERVMVIQDVDGNFELRLNQCNCEESKIISIDEFLVEIQENERQNFLLELNPEAKGFLNRIINKKGVYKYLNDQEIEKIKSNLVEEFSEKIIEELNHYKKFISMQIKEGDEVGKLKKIESELIIKAVEEDPIFSKLINKSPLSNPSALAIEVCESRLSL